ncbi:MAG: hypothetical protein ACFCD0_12525 [Gemmataceae bacterium]
MSKARAVVMFVVGAIVLVAVCLFLLGLGMIGGPPAATVKRVPPGAQELAWISPATNAGIWASIVEASGRIERLWANAGEESSSSCPHIEVNAEKAFSRENGEVPEIVYTIGKNEDTRIYLRWYKISAQNDIASWVSKLANRKTPPLGIIGGESTYRALDIANTLQKHLEEWKGEAPTFLITTATADNYFLTEPKKTVDPTKPVRAGKPLMGVYPKRSFRFSFTNTVMTEAVMDFIDEHPELWPYEPAHAMAITTGLNPLVSATLLAGDGRPQALWAVAWNDDEYSKDLRHRFRVEFQHRHDSEDLFDRLQGDDVPHSIGDVRTPNSDDVHAASFYLEYQGKYKFPRQILALPTGAERARRYLRALTSIAPTHARRMVAVSGDSIDFNNVYRDRDIDWNVLDLPVPLVFFSHRNPMQQSAGFHSEPTNDKPWATTGTNELLFYQDLLEAVLLAAHEEEGLVSNANQFNQRLQTLRWVKGQITQGTAGPLLFQPDRNRSRGTGEHIVLVRPHRDGMRVLPLSTISVWTRERTEQRVRLWKRRGMIPKVFYHAVDPT